MSITEIPRAAWTAAMNEFSVLHEGWLISVDVWTPEIGALPEIHDMPLLAVSADRSETEGTITISAGDRSQAHVSHIIHGATAIALERQRDGATSALHIESAGGVKTSLRFRAPAIPETVAITR
ncbi:MAG: DUF5335 family protein [Vicinamibacterales bacterium]